MASPTVRNLMSWSVFAAFAVAAIALNWQDTMFRFEGATGAGKAAVWAAWVLFTGYSYYCSTRESLFRSIASMLRLHWGRQIGIDLYIGLSLSLLIVGAHEGATVALLWLAPVFLFGNLATLLYLAIHFDSLAARLAA